MARRVFFSFHYERDIWRANVVRNSWVTQEREAAGFFNASLWEDAKKKGDEAIKRMIDRGIDNTSVTVVLIGAETADRKYVLYEIEQSYKRGNGLLGIHINNIENRDGLADYQGANPFDKLQLERNGRIYLLSALVKVYDWRLNYGYQNFAGWVEEAAKAAGQ